ncbi:MAG TPA: GntR family transcriptional regulator [Opitutae bacterium]|nr:GntR family transcriptional regulator [Opitutae bacterium]
MLNIGRVNKLLIIEESEHGLYFDAKPLEKILLPNAYVTESMDVGDELEVFIYNDSEDRLVATTETPYAQVGEFAYLEVVSVNQVGAFLDWGLQKDLLLPYREQGDWTFQEGDGAIVAVYLDEYTNRIVASCRLHKHLSETKPEYEPNDPVQVLIYGDSPLGYKAIVDKQHRALLYHEETSDRLEAGDQFTGYIKQVHSNGKIDIRRDPSGRGRVASLAETILEKLEAAGGSLPFNDKSEPEAIRATFDTSKKAFKQAVIALRKEGQLTEHFETEFITLKSAWDGVETYKQRASE